MMTKVFAGHLAGYCVQPVFSPSPMPQRKHFSPIRSVLSSGALFSTSSSVVYLVSNSAPSTARGCRDQYSCHLHYGPRRAQSTPGSRSCGMYRLLPKDRFRCRSARGHSESFNSQELKTRLGILSAPQLDEDQPVIEESDAHSEGVEWEPMSTAQSKP